MSTYTHEPQTIKLTCSNFNIHVSHTCQSCWKSYRTTTVHLGELNATGTFEISNIKIKKRQSTINKDLEKHILNCLVVSWNACPHHRPNNWYKIAFYCNFVLMYQSWNFFNTFESQSTNVSYLDFGLKPAVFSCLNNALAPQLIVLESCSSSQTDQPVV